MAGVERVKKGQPTTGRLPGMMKIGGLIALILYQESLYIGGPVHGTLRDRE